MSFTQLLPAAGITAANGAPVATACVASMTTVAAASIVQGERFVIDDGRRVVIFEFDVGNTGFSKDYVTGSQSKNGPLNVWLIPISGMTADQVRDAVIAAINSANLNLVAVSGGAATVTITHNLPGANNIVIHKQVANAGFAVSITTVGAFSGVWYPVDREDVAMMEIWTTGAGSPVSLNLKLWEWSLVGKQWLAVLPGPDGLLQPSGGTAPANDARRAETLQAGSLNNGDRIYLDVSGTFAGSTVFAQIITNMQRRTA